MVSQQLPHSTACSTTPTSQPVRSGRKGSHAAAARAPSRVRLFAPPWTAAHQAPPSMGFPRKEYWSGVLCLLRSFPWKAVNRNTQQLDLRRRPVGRFLWQSAWSEQHERRSTAICWLRVAAVQLLSLTATPWTVPPGSTVLHHLPGICSDPRPLSWCYHPTISSSVTLFSSCPQSFPASGSFPMSGLVALSDQGLPHAKEFTMHIRWSGEQPSEANKAKPTPQFRFPGTKLGDQAGLTAQGNGTPVKQSVPAPPTRARNAGPSREVGGGAGPTP